jgi:acyl-CoA thioesterase-1
MRFTALAFFALLAPLTAVAEGLPRVLILGDRICRQPAQQVATLLKGKAEIVCPNTPEVFNTTTALAGIDGVLDEGKWDLIHFNFGLGDLVHRAPGMKSFRTMSKEVGGIRATSPADYEKNLTALVKRLQATGAKLIWASTTPIRSEANGLFEPGSEIGSNAIAAKVMAANGVPVNDMHSAVSAMIAATKPDRGEPFQFGRLSIHPMLLSAICRQLSIPVPEEAKKQPL